MNNAGSILGSLLLWQALLLFTPCFAGADSVVEDGGDDRQRHWELGLGFTSGWAQFQEAGVGDVFKLSKKPGQGVTLHLCWRISSRVGLAVDIGAQNHDTNLEEVTGNQSLALLGFRYQPVMSGGILPYLQGSFGAAGMELASTGDSSESLLVKGMAGSMGVGVRLAFSPRLQFDLGLDHTVINYRDASVLLESLYTGNRIDKAGSMTRLRLVTVFLF